MKQRVIAMTVENVIQEPLKRSKKLSKEELSSETQRIMDVVGIEARLRLAYPHDFRPLGAPLGEDCLDNVIDLCHQLLDGTYSPVTVKSFWGPWSGRPDVTMICKGKNYLGWNPELIYDKDAE